MKKNEVKIGGVYQAKVNDKLASVRIDAENASGGWDATNLDTNRKVRIKSAQRLRGKAAAASKATNSPTSATGATKAAPVTSEAKTATGATRPKQGDRAKKVSCIDAAIKVLGESSEPMSCKQMIDAMTTKGYWTSPGGKTPHATLYSAILREIQNKGDDARFKKTERGKFAANA